jgi:beta-lactamase regulating signal transducer with metallopeptidase domain
MRDLLEYHLDSLLKASWQGAVLIALLLAAQWAFGRWLSPRWRYRLWFLVVLRLALPWMVSSPVSLFNLLNFPELVPSVAGARPRPGAQGSTVGPSTATVGKEPAEEASALQPGPARPRFGFRHFWLVELWLGGALALLIFLLATHYRLSRNVTQRRPLIDDPVMNLLEDCKQEMGVRVPVTLVETAEVGSPALFGFVRPRLLLPAGLTRHFTLEELRYVFLHELGHIKRHDILGGWLMTALQILHWFNPLVWLAFHRMRIDRELACDALALSYVGAEGNKRYGRTILKLLESFGRSAWGPSLAGTVENRSQTKERIRMIAKFKNTNPGLALAAALFAGLGVVTLTDAEPAKSQLSKDLMGTWVLAGTPGDVGLAPAEGGRLKSVTDTHWSVTETDPRSGLVIFHHGGTYTLKGAEYVEHVEYANPSTTNLIGKAFKFTIKIEGDTLTLTGIGNPWREAWKRASRSKPHKSDAAALQGTWTGQESGGPAKGAASLVVKGSSLEFHGADKKEWYKATFSVYDTDPKQLVTVITGCPFPQYVGRMGYSIYQLQDGRLTITGNEPGSLFVPATFDALGARQFVFKRK